MLAALLAGLAGPALAAPCIGAVYLTFDTGTMSNAEAIAQILREEDVRATFFLANEPTARGDRALDPSWQAYWRARVAEGHAFGNHTWSHLYQRRDENGKVVAVSERGQPVHLDRAGLCQELERVARAFASLTGQPLSAQWRAPGGRTTQQSLRWAASCGYPVHVGWSDSGYLLDDVPSSRVSNETVLKRAARDIGPGDIVLMHLGTRSRPDAVGILKPLIRALKDRGLCFASLSAPAR